MKRRLSKTVIDDLSVHAASEGIDAIKRVAGLADSPREELTVGVMATVRLARGLALALEDSKYSELADVMRKLLREI